MKKIIAPLLLLLPLLSSFAAQATCDTSWDGDEIVASIQGHALASRVRLLDKRNNTYVELTVAQVMAFQEAREAVARQLNRTPAFMFCADSFPNAWAMKTDKGEIVGVTVGMMQMVDGDRDMAAIVIGHEYTHLVLDHAGANQSREEVLNMVGLVAGMILESKLHRNVHLRGMGLGIDMGRIGARLVSMKYSRDQEREADEGGFKTMIAAGFNPNGAVRLAELMNKRGLGGNGLFYDNHPGWDERDARFHKLIADSAEAQQIIARSGDGTKLLALNGAITAPFTLGLEPAYVTTDAQKSFTDAADEWRKGDYPAAVKDYRAAAEGGYAPAQTFVGWLYRFGRGGLGKDNTEAVRMFKLAADQGDAEGTNNLGIMYLKGLGGLQKDMLEALRLYKVAAEKGSANAAKNVGDFYLNGLGGIAKDEVEALKWYQQALAMGSADAYYSLGIMYDKGVGGLEKSAMEAVKQYKLAVDRNSHPGQYALALAYRHGSGGLTVDETEAARLYKLAANGGLAIAQYDLGVIYANGKLGLPKDDAVAARLYKLAAAQDFAPAQANLGSLYSGGKGGMAHDDTEAFRLFKLSADQGNPIGQANLGWSYQNGRGVPQDRELAIEWYKKAAAQGSAFAVEHLKGLGGE